MRDPDLAPIATYRLQLNRDLTFGDVAALADYFAALGVSDCYLSPIFTARAGSSHGYDVVDHATLNPELGGEPGFTAMATSLATRHLGLVLDLVPNHMCITDAQNSWWNDVLENGPSSPFAAYFDIDWIPPKVDLEGQVLLPILGDQYGRVLEQGELKVGYVGGAFFVDYYDHHLPTAPKSWAPLLAGVLGRLHAALGEADERVLELESILTALRHLPPRTGTDPAEVRERQREKEIVKRRLATLLESAAPARVALDAALTELNGHVGDPRSFNLLESFLGDQAYRLSHWRVAADEINYRRFFDVNELAAIRVEEPAVFEAVHDLPFGLVAAKLVRGLRIDHVDGLYDPRDYLERLPGDCWVVVEKILEPGERLRADWPVHGTTGYDFLSLVGGLFVDPAARPAIRNLYARIAHLPADFEITAYACKRLVMKVALSSELTVLARRLDRISEQHRYSRDFTFPTLLDALASLVACFPVYRTYLPPGNAPVEEADRIHIEAAIRGAKRRNPATSESIFDFIASVLLRDDPPGLSDSDRDERREFALRFQQLTSPVMAKGVEDTAYYRFYPLASLAEVGGDPERFGVSVEEFHDANAARLRDWPAAMLATSTHDTKRGEDVRARLAVLSEIPPQWTEAVYLWQELNLDHRQRLDGLAVPSANEEYLFYQTLAGTWPLELLGDDDYADYVTRVQGYLLKALREAKVHTSWVNPNVQYEGAVHDFVAGALARTPDNEFLPALERFLAPLVRPGLYNGLAQVVLKATAPGVPDFYQGSELWDLSLVDPDNRRPVDFARHRELLAGLAGPARRDPAALCDELLATAEDGRVKLYVTSRALAYRHAHRDLFLRGEYLPLAAAGDRERHVVAFARRRDAAAMVTVTTRFAATLPAPPLGPATWHATLLPLPPELAAAPGVRFRDLCSGATVATVAQGDAVGLPLELVLAHLPVALLERLP
jgi:(1->4)-alpha-D-glucan 1-alpha-D-glucosylmutase